MTPDRKMVIKRLEKVSYYFKSLLAVGWQGDADIYREHRESVNMAIALLKEQEQTIKSATWVQHLYRLGSKRFECNWCHGTSWKPSDYCPDCGSRMDETVVNMDD